MTWPIERYLLNNPNVRTETSTTTNRGVLGTRARELIDVDALRESDQSQKIEQKGGLVSPVTSARSELDQIKKVEREEWLRQREQKKVHLRPLRRIERRAAKPG
jgi:hypothetical protein